jgi:hypothetical protein
MPTRCCENIRVLGHATHADQGEAQPIAFADQLWMSRIVQKTGVAGVGAMCLENASNVSFLHLDLQGRCHVLFYGNFQNFGKVGYATPRGRKFSPHPPPGNGLLGMAYSIFV